jgi:hypothetical protein
MSHSVISSCVPDEPLPGLAYNTADELIYRSHTTVHPIRGPSPIPRSWWRSRQSPADSGPQPALTHTISMADSDSELYADSNDKGLNISSNLLLDIWPMENEKWEVSDR